MTDQGFPIIEYTPGRSPRDWGLAHGETFSAGIRELYEIRIELMREKNPALDHGDIVRLAAEQWYATETGAPDLAEELDGIGTASGLSRAELVVLNNYTDFRDIQLPDEGCSIAFVQRDAGTIAGQTWDMHRSAKNYVCCLKVPVFGGEQIVFSLVGCVGMMGYSSHGTMVGVNNINTTGARPGIVWPAVVRKTLQKTSQSEMTEYLTSANVTSGHNYLVASTDRAEMWEVMPDLSECVSRWEQGTSGHLFHTNHCLGKQATSREQPTSQNSTTHIRYELLKKKIDAVNSFDDMYRLMNDHENYPKAICSNFQASSQDPSATCGGAVGDLESGKVTMWRGDAEYDDNFVRHDFQLTRKGD